LPLEYAAAANYAKRTNATARRTTLKVDRDSLNGRHKLAFPISAQFGAALLGL
jgi:hypothetical protein